MESAHDKLSIVIIQGSVRPGNYTAMAAALVADELSRNPHVTVEHIDPARFYLAPPGIDLHSEGARLIQHKVKQAAGIVLVTPEYHGSFSSVMKLVIENLGFPSALAGKPVALLGVAAGVIGAIKSLEHLRGVVSHVGAMPLPLVVSVPNVHSVFDRDGRCLEPRMEKLIRSVGTNLVEYIHHNVCPRITLERILRESGGPVNEAHPGQPSNSLQA